MTENNKYLGQLTLYLNDCPSLQKNLENTSYTQKSLINLFQNYYECSQSEISFQKEEEKIRADTSQFHLSFYCFELISIYYFVNIYIALLEPLTG